MTKQPHDADVAFIEALAEILAKNELTELQVKREYGEEGSLNVRVSRAKNVTTEVISAPAPVAVAPAPAPSPVAATAAPAAAETAADAGDPAAHPGAVTSPMVGTAYLAPEPGAPNFVSVGDKVSEGQTLMIVEAMKTMNHITAPKTGSVSRILIEDGAPVEFGTPLVIVE